jgi:hypothetical protein
MKHVGKMKNNGAKIVVVYRTLPGDPYSALVVGTNGLGESYHDSLISLVNGDSGQSANELADILAVRKFPDGSNMLAWFHTNGLLKKVPTDGVLMTPRPNTSIPLNELNQLIADQKGVALEDLAISDGTPAPARKKDDPGRTTSQSVSGEIEEPITAEVMSTEDLTPAQMRSKADALFKQAQVLRKQADTIDPPKSKTKKSAVTVE